MGIYCCERSRRLHPPVLTRSRGRRSHIHGRLSLVCYILCTILVSIPTASLLLKVVVGIAKHHKTVYVVASTSLIFQASLRVCAAITLVH